MAGWPDLAKAAERGVQFTVSECQVNAFGYRINELETDVDYSCFGWRGTSSLSGRSTYSCRNVRGF